MEDCRYLYTASRRLHHYLHVYEVLLLLIPYHHCHKNATLKGGESSSQFQWFTIAKIKLYFLIFFVLILGLRLQRYSSNTKRCPPEKVFGNSEF